MEGEREGKIGRDRNRHEGRLTRSLTDAGFSMCVCVCALTTSSTGFFVILIDLCDAICRRLSIRKRCSYLDIVERNRKLVLNLIYKRPIL